MKCIKMLTFLPMEKINEMENWPDERINEKKEILAFELTSLVHSEDDAKKAMDAAHALFSGNGNDENIPTTIIKNSEIEDNILITDLLVKCNLTQSKGEAKRLIQQGGITVNDNVITDLQKSFSKNDLQQGLKIRKGKKIFHKAVLE